MSDPALEAVQRAWAKDGHAVGREARVPITAAREALAPIREWYEGFSDQMPELERLIYTTEETNDE